MNRKGVNLNLIDFIAGVTLVLSGLVTIFGRANLGAVLGGIGLLVEALKIMIKSGF